MWELKFSETNVACSAPLYWQLLSPPPGGEGGLGVSLTIFHILGAKYGSLSDSCMSHY